MFSVGTKRDHWLTWTILADLQKAFNSFNDDDDDDDDDDDEFFL